jgi:REP element-mobilizing transposase RayT
MMQAVAQPDHIHFLELVLPPDDAPKDILLLSSGYKS